MKLQMILQKEGNATFISTPATKTERPYCPTHKCSKIDSNGNRKEIQQRYLRLKSVG